MTAPGREARRAVTLPQEPTESEAPSALSIILPNRRNEMAALDVGWGGAAICLRGWGGTGHSLGKVVHMTERLQIHDREQTSKKIRNQIQARAFGVFAGRPTPHPRALALEDT